MLRVWLQPLASLLAGVLALAGIIAAGQAAHAALQRHEAYLVRFTDTECEPPAGLTRVEFLDEVQYLAHLPDQVPLLDPMLPSRLAQAFQRHPWVENVMQVELLPGRRIRVELKLRRAVLAVCLASRLSSDGSATTAGNEGLCFRVVDRHGILLPAGTARSKLPLLQGVLHGPEGPPGTLWKEATVRDAASLASFLGPQWEALQMPKPVFEADGTQFVVHSGPMRVRWGHAPGHEVAGEAPAPIKLNWLRELASQQKLAGFEVDLRPATGVRRTLPASEQP